MFPPAGILTNCFCSSLLSQKQFLLAYVWLDEGKDAEGCRKKNGINKMLFFQIFSFQQLPFLSYNMFGSEMDILHPFPTNMYL